MVRWEMPCAAASCLTAASQRAMNVNRTVSGRMFILLCRPSVNHPYHDAARRHAPPVSWFRRFVSVGVIEFAENLGRNQDDRDGAKAADQHRGYGAEQGRRRAGAEIAELVRGDRDHRID